MKCNRLLLIVFGLFFTICQAQDAKEISKQRAKLKLFDEEKTSNTNSKFLGKIVFANSEIKKDDSETKYISTYTFGDKLYIRSFLANSVANSILIQLVEKGAKSKALNEDNSTTGFSSVIYKLYLDGKEVTQTNKGKFYGDEIISSLNIMSCINDGTDNELFGEALYMELLNHPELLTPGNHKMKIEMLPVCPNCPNNITPDKILAVGEIDMIIPKELKVTESDCFPKKQWSDIKLEAEVLKACKNSPNAFKVIITDKDYTVIRKEYTDAIIKKCFIAAVVSKNGKEVSYDFYIFEKVFDGVNYSPLKMSRDLELNNHLIPKGKKVNADCLKYLK
jgi:hypothetical protein